MSLQQILQDFQPVSQEVEAKTGDVVAKHGDAGATAVYEVILARADHVIVRIKGPHKAGTPLKLQMPKMWPAGAQKIDDANFILYTKKGTEVGAPTKAKKAGPKREGPTKMDKCREVVLKMKDGASWTKVDYIAAFCAPDIGCTPAGANTYYLTLKKQYSLP